ncbi:MAG: tyrosine-type recombinase/integrase [Elusimicrobiota bacterium]|jgi:site-specific recombinase XerD
MSGLEFSVLSAESLTWEQATRAFLLRCRAQDVSPGTIEHYRGTLAGLVAFLVPIGVAKPGDAAASHLRAYLEDRKDQGLASETLHTRWRHLRTFFRFLRRDGLLLLDPSETLEAPRVERRLMPCPTPDQFRKIIEQLRGRDPLDVRDYAIMCFLADTGARLSEALALKLGDVDMAGGTARLLGKGRRERLVAFGSAARTALLAWLRARGEGKPEERLFVDRFGGPLTRGAFGQRFRRLARAAGVYTRRLSPHALRHFFAIQFLRNGGGVLQLQRLLGHSTLAMTKRYAALTDDDSLADHRKASPLDRLGPLPGERKRVRLR